MKVLQELIKGIKISKEQHDYKALDRFVAAICFDSRKVQKDNLFVALVGTQTNGHDYIEQAIDKGATVIFCEKMPEKTQATISYFQVENTAVALAELAANFYDHPSKKLKLIGITGTNGKSSTVVLLHQLFGVLGYRVGLFSTIQNKVGENTMPSTHTTPDALQLQENLAKMLAEGCTHVFMEVSSHALDQKRVHALHFTGGIFSNITRDHLDYHQTFDNYIKAKKSFFDQLPKSAFALSNIDDKNGLIMLQNTLAKKYTYALKTGADFKLKILENTLNGLHLKIDQHEVSTQLLGSFNAYNLLAVYATAMLLGESQKAILKAISILNPVNGRYHYFKSSSGVHCIVDYAHTPDALEKILQNIQELKNSNQQLFTIFGCGGNRDKGKRTQMTQVACAYSDYVGVTSDNPRFEDPQTIIDEMLLGLPKIQQAKISTNVDRAKMIQHIVAKAKTNDIILLAGKGHENYQEIQGKKEPFNDEEVLLQAFNK